MSKCRPSVSSYMITMELCQRKTQSVGQECLLDVTVSNPMYG